jgi:hypothetical protein
MNYYLHLKSNFDAFIEVNKLQLGLVKKNAVSALSLEVCENYPLLLRVTPLTYPEDEKKLLPYLTKINFFNGFLEVSNDLVKVVHYPNNNYELILNKNLIYNHELPKVLSQTSYNIKNFSHTATVFYDGINQLTIEDRGLLFTHKIKEDLITAEIEKIKNSQVIMLEAKTKANKLYCLVLTFNNSKYEVLKECLANKIEKGNKTITFLTHLNDMGGHGFVEECELTQEKLNIKEDYVVYLNDKAKTTNLPELVPYAFLEAVKCKNFVLARNYLQKELSDSLQDEHLIAYFGDFVEVKPALYEKAATNKLALIYEDKKTFAKIFVVELEKNKISNFSEG